MTHKILSALLTSSLLIACGVSQGDPNAPPPGDVAASDKQRLTTAAPASDVTKAVDGNTDFAFNLYRSLVSPAKDDNLFVSPQSVSVALSMAYAGSAGATTTAFEQALKIGLPQDRYHHAMNQLDRDLASRGQGAKAADGKAFRLNITNQLFAERTFRFEGPYLDTLAQEYGAGLRLMNFVGAPDPARVRINDWVENKTEHRIKDLLSPGTVTPDTRAVLVNAVYFNASWRKQFDPRNSKGGTFTSLGGHGKNVTMMYEYDMPARAANLNGVEVVSLPYDGDELSLVMMMPRAGDFERFEHDLSAATLTTLVGGLQNEALTLTMPKFEIKSAKSLAQPLIDLGLGVAFTEGADFSAMSKQAQLSISDVIHQTFVKVGETGTEAAAATAVIIGTTSIPQTRVVTLDRPFVFVIRDNATGAIVFLGRLVDP